MILEPVETDVDSLKALLSHKGGNGGFELSWCVLLWCIVRMLDASFDWRLNVVVCDTHVLPYRQRCCCWRVVARKYARGAFHLSQRKYLPGVDDGNLVQTERGICLVGEYNVRFPVASTLQVVGMHMKRVRHLGGVWTLMGARGCSSRASCCSQRSGSWRQDKSMGRCGKTKEGGGGEGTVCSRLGERDDCRIPVLFSYTRGCMHDHARSDGYRQRIDNRMPALFEISVVNTRYQTE